MFMVDIEFCVWEFFSSSNWNPLSFHFIYLFFFPVEQSTDSFSAILLKVIYFSSPANFKVFSLSLFFSSLTMICLGMAFSVITLPGIRSTFSAPLLSFEKKFCHYYFKYCFYFILSYSQTLSPYPMCLLCSFLYFFILILYVFFWCSASLFVFSVVCYLLSSTYNVLFFNFRLFVWFTFCFPVLWWNPPSAHFYCVFNVFVFDTLIFVSLVSLLTVFFSLDFQINLILLYARFLFFVFFWIEC